MLRTIFYFGAETNAMFLSKDFYWSLNFDLIMSCHVWVNDFISFSSKKLWHAVKECSCWKCKTWLYIHVSWHCWLVTQVAPPLTPHYPHTHTLHTPTLHTPHPHPHNTPHTPLSTHTTLHTPHYPHPHTPHYPHTPTHTQVLTRQRRRR